MKTKMTPEQLAVKARLLAETKARHEKDWERPGFAERYADWEKEYTAETAMCAARKKANLTQTELAKRIHTPRENISRMENGQNVTFATFARYLRGCGFDFSLRIFPIGKGKRSTAKAGTFAMA